VILVVVGEIFHWYGIGKIKKVDKV